MISFETNFNPEIPSREQVVSMFKTHGESPEAIDVYSKWFIEKMKEADESGSEYSRLIFNIAVADLLIDCEMIEDAYVYLDQTWDMIEGEIARTGEENMPKELMDLLEKLRIVSMKVGDQ